MLIKEDAYDLKAVLQTEKQIKKEESSEEEDYTKIDFKLATKQMKDATPDRRK